MLQQSLYRLYLCTFFFLFNAPPTTEIYTLSLHDALPISMSHEQGACEAEDGVQRRTQLVAHRDRKSTRLNSSHRCISYAVFCLKKKKQKTKNRLIYQ